MAMLQTVITPKRSPRRCIISLMPNGISVRSIDDRDPGVKGVPLLGKVVSVQVWSVKAYGSRQPFVLIRDQNF